MTTTCATHQQHPALTGVKLAGLIIVLVLLMALGSDLVGTLARSPNLAIVPAAVLIGYLAADFVSGTVHWFCDTFFNEETPVIGQFLIRPFRDHHTQPRRITEYDLLSQDASNYFIVLPPLLIAWSSGGADADSWLAVASHAALFGFAVGSVGTNLFHKWAHAEEVPMAVRWLQRRRVILAPNVHRVHHRNNYRGYCVTSGWMNGILDRVEFFPRAERLIRRLARRPAFAPTPDQPGSGP